MPRLAIGLVALIGWCAAPCAAQVPTLQRLSPLGIEAGQPTVVRLTGTGLADINRVWAGFATASPVEPPPAKVDATAKPDTTRAAFAIHPRSDVVPGVYAVRVAAAGGVSNLKLLVIDDLPTVNEVSTNIEPAKAQKLLLPTAVDGSCQAEQIDYYTFTARAGQRLSFEVLAKRIASPLDPLLRLVEISTGRVLAESDDDAVIGADARFAYRFEQAGDYRLELRDIRYAGGTNHVYRLRIGEFPLTAAPFPAVVKKGLRNTLEASDLADGGSVRFVVDGASVSAGPVVPLAVRYANRAPSGFSAALVSERDEQLEQEPNDDAKQAGVLTASAAMNGRFAVPRDRDFYKLAGKKGDRFRIVGRTRSLGAPTDLYLQLYAPDGKRLIAETDDAGLDEGVLDATLDADGQYLAVVEDLIGRGGPEFVYRLEVERNQPGFTAAVDLEKFDVPHAGLAAAKVTVLRSGYTGEIHFRVEGATDVEAVGVVPADKSDATVQLCFPPEYRPGAMLNVRLVAFAPKEPFAAEVGSAAALRKALGGLPTLPPSLAEQITVGITPPSKANFALKAKGPITWNADGTQGELNVTIERNKGFVEAVALQTCGLPPGYEAPVVTVARDKTEGKIVVRGPQGQKPPAKSIFVIGTATVKKLLTQSSLADVPLVPGAPVVDQAKAKQTAPARNSTRVEP